MNLVLLATATTASALGTMISYHLPPTTSFDDFCGWMKSGSPLGLSISISILYAQLLFDKTTASPDQRKFAKKTLQPIYNVVQILFNVWHAMSLFVLAHKNGWPAWSNANPVWSPTLGALYWLYYLNKIVDCVDTVFIKLSGKKISYLHAIHHGGQIWFVHFILATFPMGDTWFPAFLNSTIHAFMYTWYFLVSQKNLKWAMKITKLTKPFLTLSQMGQFVLILWHCANALVPKIIVVVTVLWMAVLLGLFAHFFNSTYSRSSKENVSTKLSVPEIIKMAFENSNVRHLITFHGSEEEFYKDVARRGRLAIAEGFVNKTWTCPLISLPYVITKIYTGFLPYREMLKYAAMSWSFYLSSCMGYLKSVVPQWSVSSLESRSGCADVHYNIDVNFWFNTLGKHLSYSTGQFTTEKDLGEAQEAKLKYYADKVLGLADKTPEELKQIRVLDIGCGWGSWVNFLCKNYPGVQVTGLTNATTPGESDCLHENVELIVGDMHTVEIPKKEGYDFITMMEIEHVGRFNYVPLFKKFHNMLKPTGRLVMQSINLPFEDKYMRDEFMIKYIYPGGYMPSTGLLAKSAENANLKMIYQYEWGSAHANVTYYHWFMNVVNHYKEYDERFSRIQTYYLASVLAYTNPHALPFKNARFRVSTHIFTRNDSPSSMTEFYPRGLAPVATSCINVDYEDFETLKLKDS